MRDEGSYSSGSVCIEQTGVFVCSDDKFAPRPICRFVFVDPELTGCGNVFPDFSAVYVGHVVKPCTRTRAKIGANWRSGKLEHRAISIQYFVFSHIRKLFV